MGYVSRCTCTRRTHEESLAGGALTGGRFEPAIVPEFDGRPKDRAPTELAKAHNRLRNAEKDGNRSEMDQLTQARSSAGCGRGRWVAYLASTKQHAAANSAHNERTGRTAE